MSNINIPKKIGISGGTFDPIHLGHLIIAEEAREIYGLEKILFIPSGNPPHKKDYNVTCAEYRFEMVKEAIYDNVFFEASPIEINREGYSYTIDTLLELKKMYGGDALLYFITGADVIPELITWKKFEQIFEICEFIAALRPGYNKEAILREIEIHKKAYGAKISTLDNPLIGISSTIIRERVKNGRTIKYLVPERVEKFIREKGLYNY